MYFSYIRHAVSGTDKYINMLFGFTSRITVQRRGLLNCNQPLR
jgi:hypothetical protein